MENNDFVSIQSQIMSGNLTVTQLVSRYLKAIESTKHLNAYVEVFTDEAIEHAKLLDERFSKNPNSMGRLYGMVISIKDVICYKGHQVTGGSKILAGFESLFTSTALQRLLDEDVIVIGRVNCDEFAMGSGNENSAYGPTINALGDNRVPGGSSGASAVAVQTNTCTASIGSDTGGSVRQPAAFCGLVGMKPTYGRISRYGLLAYASSFDQIGTLTHTVADAALLLEIMAGPDEYDSTASPSKAEKYSDLDTQLGPKKIAYFESTLNHPSIDPEIRTASLEFLEKLKTDGHEVVSLDFNLLDYLIPAYYVLTTAEASTNLSRYDGVRFGYRSAEVVNLQDSYKKSRTEGFGTEVKRRILLGTFVLSSGYYDAYYQKAQKVRRLITEQTKEIFQSFDYIIMPVTPTVAWKIGEKSADPVAAYLADIYTVQANMTGIPAIAIPLGKNQEKMPFGIQIMADRYKEYDLLKFVKNIDYQKTKY
jgi:aspartyl-tRNA(Asn)/glutamyl-tRNA(Gln) amidotransferase subunit A